MHAGLFETIFWIFFGGIVLSIAGTAIGMAMRWNDPPPLEPPRRKKSSAGGAGADMESYGIASASMSESVQFADPSYSSDLGTDSGGDTGGSGGGGDFSGGDFSGGGGDSGGGGSSGGW